MKKSKIMLSTLAAAVFATSAGALVACGEDVQLPDGLANKGAIEITFDANGGLFADNTAIKKVNTNLNGLIALQPETPTYNDKVFTGYYLEKDADGTTKITYGTNGYQFTTAITVYAHWQDPVQQGGNSEYTITFYAGTNGTCATTELTTVNGKITLPQVVADNGYTFKGWYTQATGGEKVENDKEYTGATSLYAQYEQVQQGGNTEYTITIDAGEHGTYGATSLTTTGGKLVGLTDATPNSGYTFDGWYTAEVGGELVTANTVFDRDGAIYAHYSIEHVVNPNIDPEPPARIYNSVTINGVAMDDTTDTIDRTWVEYPNYQGYQNHTLADQFETYLTVTTETTYTLKAGDTPISTLWIQHPESDNIKVKVGDMFVPAKTDEGNEGLNGSSFTLAKGEYSVYFKVYEDGGRCIWITGSMEEDFEGGGEERPTTDPNSPASTVSKATINDVEMDRETINRNWTADPKNPDGGYYNNHTMTDQFKAELTVTEVTTYTFKADGAAISGMYIEFAENLEFKIDGVIATVKTNGTSLTFAPGTYTIYLKKYVSDGDFTMWVQGTKTGEWGNSQGGGEEENDTAPEITLKNGTTTLTVVDNTENKAENETAKFEYKLSTGTVALSKNDVLTIAIDGVAVNPQKFGGRNTNHGVEIAGGKITVLADGTFTFYLRYYEDNEWWEVEMSDGKTDDETLNAEHWYIVGSVSNWTCVARYDLTAAGGSITKYFEADTEIKIAQWDSTTTNTPYWDGTNYGYSSVTSGLGFVKNSGGNISFKKSGTYTITFSGTSIQITSSDVEEDTNTPYSANVTFADGKTATLIFNMPQDWGLSATELNSCWITIKEADKAANIKSDGSVELDAIAATIGKVTIKVEFKQGNATKWGEAEITLEDGGNYMLNWGNPWSGDNFTLTANKLG